MMRKWAQAAFLAAIMAASCIASASSAQTTPFYRGKTITLYIGSSTGGIYDVHARLLARHIGRHCQAVQRRA